MWNISSNDVEHAKESIKLRRTEVETRYAEEKEVLDAEFAVIETLERAASAFALKRNREPVQAVGETTTTRSGWVAMAKNGPTHAGACISVTERLMPTVL